MLVHFSRTQPRRYAIRVELPTGAKRVMDPAPGYDAKIPHDAIHFVVEREFGIKGGVFGQLAAGGHARTFQLPQDDGLPHREHVRATRKFKRTGEALAKRSRADMARSERLACLCERAWRGLDETAALAAANVHPTNLKEVCAQLQRVSDAWQALEVGGAVTLRWPG